MRMRHLTQQQVQSSLLSSSNKLLSSSNKYLLGASYVRGPELDAVIQTERYRLGLGRALTITAVGKPAPTRFDFFDN